MAKKIVRGITDIKKINLQDFDTNNVNDLLSDGEHNYIHRKKKDNTEEYHNLTNNIKTISSANTDLLTVTNNNNSNNTATIRLTDTFVNQFKSITNKGSFRNLILKSNDFANPYKTMIGTPTGTTVVGHAGDYFTLKTTGATTSPWGGIAWQTPLTEINQGEEFSVFVPIFIDGSVAVDGKIRVEIKDSSNNFIWNYDLPTTTKNQWVNVQATFTATKTITIGNNHAFTISLSKNGSIRIKPPMWVRGRLIPCDFQPAFEDMQNAIAQLATELASLQATVANTDESTTIPLVGADGESPEA